MSQKTDEPALPPLLLTPKQAAEILGIGMTSLYQMLNAGQLESVQLGRARRIKYSSILQLAENGTASGRRGNPLGLRIAG